MQNVMFIDLAYQLYLMNTLISVQYHSIGKQNMPKIHFHRLWRGAVIFDVMSNHIMPFHVYARTYPCS